MNKKEAEKLKVSEALWELFYSGKTTMKMTKKEMLKMEVILCGLVDNNLIKSSKRR